MRRSIKRKKIKFDKKELKFNRAIRAPIINLIDEEGKAIGEMKISDALSFAEERGYDLVEVSPKAEPPVVKLMDYGEYKYKKEKLEQKRKARQKKIDIKGIRLSLRISKHDLELRKKRAEEFMEEGHKVKIDLILKGRERQHKDLAIDIMNNFVNELDGKIKKEQPLQMQGKILSMIIMKE